MTHGTEELDGTLTAAGQILDVNQVEAAGDGGTGKVRQIPFDARDFIVLAELAHLGTTQGVDGNHALVGQVGDLHLVGQGIAFVGVVSIVRIGHHSDEVEVIRSFQDRSQPDPNRRW